MYRLKPYPPPVGESVQYCTGADGPSRPALVLRSYDDERLTADLVTFRDEGTEVKAVMEYNVPCEGSGDSLAPHYRRLR